MEFLVEYGMLMLVGVIVAVYVIHKVMKFGQMTPEQRLNEYYNIIRKLVLEANIYMDSEPGHDKLRVVYAQFAKQYPALAQVITYAQFADFVEKVLADIKLEEVKEINK